MTHPIMYDVSAIHVTHMMNVKTYQDFNLLLLQSGMVISNIRLMGQVTIHHSFSYVELGQDVMLTMSTKKERAMCRTFYVTRCVLFTSKAAALYCIVSRVLQRERCESEIIIFLIPDECKSLS